MADQREREEMRKKFLEETMKAQKTINKSPPKVNKGRSASKTKEDSARVEEQVDDDQNLEREGEED